jgi:hypothetical protein
MARGSRPSRIGRSETRSAPRNDRRHDGGDWIEEKFVKVRDTNEVKELEAARSIKSFVQRERKA